MQKAPRLGTNDKDLYVCWYLHLCVYINDSLYVAKFLGWETNKMLYSKFVDIYCKRSFFTKLQPNPKKSIMPLLVG